jgi:hypothetical protein
MNLLFTNVLEGTGEVPKVLVQCSRLKDLEQKWPSLQWVPGVLPSGIKRRKLVADGPIPSRAEVNMWSYNPISHYGAYRDSVTLQDVNYPMNEPI